MNWYQDVYLQSPHWQTYRKIELARTDGWCERCRSSPAVDVHHLPSGYKRLWHERPGVDTSPLCRDCHAYIHRKSTFDPTNWHGQRLPGICLRCRANPGDPRICAACSQVLQSLGGDDPLLSPRLEERRSLWQLIVQIHST